MNYLAVIIFLIISCIFPLFLSMKIVNIDDYDPGCCNKTNAFQVYSVKDRNDKTRLWICSKEKGKYLWKSVNGKSFVGEYLSPGYDCSDILNREENVQDGYYWINLGGSNKRKVWCDMKTDGGGFILVARKHDAITWNVPSKDKPVNPSCKDKYWTSQLGDLPILDFRIQMSTSDSFVDTKAHWFYRLNGTRKLENLMITDQGCDTLSPGIGGIAYVKDLIANKIVTTSFKCSVFGQNTAAKEKIGWSMMNDCLKNPCGGSGYLHFTGQKPIKFEANGVFSYSVSNSKSGLFKKATAYLGCLHGKCCGCYGPPGGTDNYCDTKCNAINGGSVISDKNIYTWIWVRSSLPKRVWDKCMEYQSEDEFGQIQWYTLKGDSVVPKKGKCQKKDKPRLNSGVVVVSDNKTAEKVPQIPGLLEFRLDQKELYVRANKSWNILPQEKEINEKFTNLQKNLEAKLNELMKKIEETDVELKKKLNSSYTELKSDMKLMKTTDSEFKKKLTNLEADLKQKLNKTSAELNKKINDENTKIKTKLVFSKSNHKEITKVCGGQYRWLTSSTRRYSYTSYRYCDSRLSGWYRFGGSAGTMMFSGCIRHRSSRCGTNYPGHLTGGHPGVNDGIVSRVVCFSYTQLTLDYSKYYSGYCCYYRRTIKVLNCGSFYVYKLNGVPTCNSRYCSTG